MLAPTFFLDIPNGIEDTIEYTRLVLFLSLRRVFQDVFPGVLS